MTKWSPEADHVDLYNKAPKASSDSFSVSDLGMHGMVINEDDFADCV